MAKLRLSFNIHFDHRHAGMIQFAARRSGLKPIQFLELIIAQWFREAGDVPIQATQVLVERRTQGEILARLEAQRVEIARLKAELRDAHIRLRALGAEPGDSPSGLAVGDPECGPRFVPVPRLLPAGRSPGAESIP